MRFFANIMLRSGPVGHHNYRVYTKEFISWEDAAANVVKMRGLHAEMISNRAMPSSVKFIGGWVDDGFHYAINLQGKKNIEWRSNGEQTH